jgi:hypothetical protein
MQNDEALFANSTSFDLEQHCSKSIRAGYVERNSLDLDFRSESGCILHTIRQDTVLRSTSLAPSQGFTILGRSGIGKWRII